MKITTTTTPRILKTLSQSALSPSSLLLTTSIFLFLFWTTKSYATDCCPDFMIKDLVEICPPGGACDEGDGADGHHQSVTAACKEIIHTYTAYPNDPSLYTYEWTVVGGTPASFTGNPIDIEWGTGNKGYITVVITGANGCEATITEEICLIDGPQANFSFDPNPVCENTSVLFTNLSVGGGEYYWDFGDGNYSTAFNPVHSYAAAGIYEVTLTVTDFGQSFEGGESANACGCSDSITFTVEVLEGQGPIIESDCCDGTVCPIETSTFYTNAVCTSYNWSVTGGTIIAGAGTSEIVVEWDATYSVPTTVSLETPGCADTPCAGITTIGVPVLYPNLPISGDTNFCQGTNETFSIPSMPGTYYTWTVSGGDYSINNSDLNSSHINVSFISQGTFTIEVEYDNPLAGCSGSSSIVVEAKPLFTVFGEDLVCENSKELYLANGDVSSWLVTPAGPTVDSVSSASAEITWNNAGIHIVSAEAANPALFCNAIAIQQVEVVSPPLLDPIDGPTEVCPDTYLTYFISSDTEGSFFNWSIDPPGSGTIFSEMGADKDSIVVAFHGAGPWTLEVYQETEVSPGITCISDIETLVVEAQAPPVISSQSTNTIVCVDAVETYFTALPVPIGGFTWEINPPNRGTIVSGQGTEEVEIRWHGPPANATLSVSSCAGSDQILIEIIDPPLIDWIFPDGPTLYCLPDTPNNLTLSTSLDPNFTYQWYLDGVLIPGATGHEYTITSLPAVPQEYLYEVVASNGACTKTRERLVVVENCGGDPPPPLQCDLDFTFNPDPACVGQPVSFNAISFPPNYDFAWEFGDNSTSFTQNTEKAFNAPGIYEVTLTGTWFDQCSLVVVKQVEVNPLPSCEVFATDTIFCPGDSLLLEACQGMTGYQWYREGSPIPGADQQTYWATQHGLYQVEATNQFGCSDLSEGVYIFSHSLPRAKISGEQSICVNPGWFFNMELSTPYDPDYSYEWSSSLAGATFNPNNGNNAASTNAQFQLPNPLPPQISFYVSVTDVTTGCVNTDTLCVTVNQIPYAEFSWQSACEGTPLTFTPSVIDTSQYHYLWSNGATTPEITVSTPGFYILQITDQFSGCTLNAAAGMINPLPDVSLFPTGCETLEIDEVLDLYIPLPLSSTAWNNTIPIAYPGIEWFDTDGNSLGSGENLAFSSSTDGYFEVYAVIMNGFGCEATTVVFCITVLPDSEEPEPAITVTKTLTSINGDLDQTAFTQVGDVLTYEIVVCNNGNVPLFNVGVIDPFTGLSEIINQLDAGDCATFTTSYTITQDDLDLCVFENIVVVSGEDEDGNEVADMDAETVPCEDSFIPDPGLTVTKTLASINDDPNQTAFTQVGDILTFTIVVTNTGNVPLTNVVVDDPVTGDSWTITVLNPGDSQTFTTTYVITQGNLDSCTIRNVVTATGDDPDGNQVSDGDVISVPCDPEGQDPDISVTKNLSDINGDSSITSYTQVGDVLTYTIVATNTGSVTLFNVVVTDPLTGLSQNIPVMAPGDSVTLTTSYTITQADLDNGYVLNTVTAVGQDQFGNTVSDDDFEIVPGCIEELHPQLTVNKGLSHINGNADQTTFNQVGDVLTYTITVVNTGNITLTNVVIIDPMTGLNHQVPGSLAPGDSVSVTTSYVIQQFDLDKCFLLNLGYATGEDPYGFVVSHSDFEIVECEEDTGLYDFGDAPEGAIAYPPSTIGFFPTCTNTGPPGSFVRHSGNHELFFGETVDYEFDGNAGNCPTFSPNLYDQDECFQDGDAGLIMPRAYTITGPVGSESIVPCTTGGPWVSWFTCRMAVWGRTVDIHVTNNLPNGATAYVNVLVDWNMSGEWGGSVPCSGNNLAHEHALVNFPVPNGFSGPLSQLSPPNFRIGPEAGYVWTRFSVTDTPVVQDWDGSGSFDFGETEDYLIRTRPLFVIPDGWVIGGVSVALGEEVCFSALDNIVAGGEEGPFVVEEGGAAELGAGRRISLQPGVRVEAGGYFHARIVTDDDYCIWEEGLDMATEPVGPAETVEEEDIPVSEPLELPEVFGFNVFPNPTTGTLNIELLTHSDSQSIRIEIYNMMGERVFWKEEAVASHYELDLSSQPPGMYFIRVSDGTATETQRVVKR